MVLASAFNQNLIDIVQDISTTIYFHLLNQTFQVFLERACLSSEQHIGIGVRGKVFHAV